MPNNRLTISIHMPTQREYDKHNPEPTEYQAELKREHQPAWRPRFLDHAVPDVGSSLIIKVIVTTLALYGLYHLIF